LLRAARKRVKSAVLRPCGPARRRFQLARARAEPLSRSALWYYLTPMAPPGRLLLIFHAASALWFGPSAFVPRRPRAERLTSVLGTQRVLFTAALVLLLCRT
jgi:hypothetical protein